MSQFDLENEIGASAGVISRIESGKVNPTKETIREIAKTLKLNNRELDYLIGVTALPPSEEEIRLAIEQVKPYFQKASTFAYLIDERWRLLAYSKGIERLLSGLKDSPEVLERSIGKSMVEVIFGKKNKLKGRFFSSNYYNNPFQKYQLSRYKQEVAFMVDDESFLSTLETINNDTNLSKTWRQLEKELINTNSVEGKTTFIKILGIEVKLIYSREPLPSMPRFETIEIFPTNKLLKLLKRLV